MWKTLNYIKLYGSQDQFCLTWKFTSSVRKTFCVRMRSKCPCRWAFLLVQATVRNQGPLVCLLQMKPCAFYKNCWYFIRFGGRVGWSGVVQPVEEGWLSQTLDEVRYLLEASLDNRGKRSSAKERKFWWPTELTLNCGHETLQNHHLRASVSSSSKQG